MSTQFADNPWPDADPGKIIFILDVANSFEQELLQQWLAGHNPGSGVPVTVALSLSGDQSHLDSRALVGKLQVHADTVLAPLRVTWLPSQAAIDSGPRLRDFLFGDPRRPSPKRARRILQDTPEQVHFIAAAPGSIEELQEAFAQLQHAGAEEPRDKFAAFVARRASIILDLSERRLQGGRYKVPRYVAESLLTSRAYLSGLEELARSEGESLDKVLNACRAYIKEMVSIPRTFWIDVNARFNQFVLGLGYEDEIVCDVEAVEKMRKMVRESPAMLLWTHKTYLDGMVVPKVLYDHDFPLPHMFGGANMSFVGLGFLLRRSGAIFIRRSFKDNPAYKLTLRHFLGYLMEKRVPMTWAFEGTRSRMGKLMPP
ncbi:MAG: 1-acyl-sn-glycerol-3-phosphate acyltransferase, partial [Lysobacterales bacterium]